MMEIDASTRLFVRLLTRHAHTHASISQLQIYHLRIENWKIYRLKLVCLCVCVKNLLQKFSKLTFTQ